LHHITLDYGADDPLLLEVTDDALVADCRGPRGVTAAAVRGLVAAAVDEPVEGPPLTAHVVPGDRVVIGVAGDVPRAADVIAVVVERLATAGVSPADVTVLSSPRLEAAAASSAGAPAGAIGTIVPGAVAAGGVAAGVGTTATFDPTSEPQTSYMAADEAGRPIHLARALVDADVVVTLGGWSWDPAFGGRSLEGELWPAFSRRQCRLDLVRSITLGGRRGLTAWKEANREATWQLGVCASLRLVAGRGDTLAGAAFGPPEAAAARARTLAEAWSPLVGRPAAVSIASLSEPRGGVATLLRGVAAAARVTLPGGTICVASRLDERPGVIFARWREGTPLEPLVKEAVRTGDPVLLADAFRTRLFARTLGDRRLVLLSDLDEDTLGELDLGHASTPEVVERLAHRAASVTVLHEADRLLPRLA
jgi:hypothetical protein